MSQPPLAVRPPPDAPSTQPETPSSILTDDLDGPLCALSLYLSVAERVLHGSEIDRETLGQALRGARAQLDDLAQKTAAAREALP